MFSAGFGGMMGEKSEVQPVDSNCVSYAGDLGGAIWETKKGVSQSSHGSRFFVEHWISKAMCVEVERFVGARAL